MSNITVGCTVRFTGNWRTNIKTSRHDIANNFKKAVIIEVRKNSCLPYQVLFINGEKHWYYEEEVEKELINAPSPNG